MPYDDRLTPEKLLTVMSTLAEAGHEFVSSAQLVQATGSSLPAVKRILARLAAGRRVELIGKARATRYRLPTPSTAAAHERTAVHPTVVADLRGLAPPWSAGSLDLRQRLALPLGSRSPVTYQREFVDEYKPNETFLLP